MRHAPNQRLSRRNLLATSLVAGAAAAAGYTDRTAANQTPATPAAATDSDALFADLDALIVERMAKLQIPGVAVGVIADGREHAAGFGVTNIDHPLPVDTETLFQIGSTSKTFTGLALARLAEQGALDLESPVRDFLPGFRVADPVVSEAVRLRHLVTHTSGWFDPTDLVDTGDGDDALARYVAAMTDRPQIAPLGRYFSYSNSGFCVAGRVIEVVAGQPFETAMRELIQDPLGMEQTAYFAEQIMTEAFAVGHVAPPDDPAAPPAVAEPWALPRSANPAGGLIASVADLLRYARFQLGDGTANGQRLLSAKALRRTRTPLGPGGTVPGEGSIVIDDVGVAWMLWRRGGERIVSHAGGTNGQMSTFLFVPDRGFALSLLTNTLSGILLGFEVTDWALERFLGLRRSPVEAVPVDREQTAQYAGVYALPDGSQAIRVGETNDGLEIAWSGVGQPEGASPLRIVGDDLATMQYLGAALLAEFVRDDSGNVAWVRFLGRLVPRAN